MLRKFSGENNTTFELKAKQYGLDFNDKFRLNDNKLCQTIKILKLFTKLIFIAWQLVSLLYTIFKVLKMLYIVNNSIATDHRSSPTPLPPPLWGTTGGGKPPPTPSPPLPGNRELSGCTSSPWCTCHGYGRPRRPSTAPTCGSRTFRRSESTL